MKYTGICVLALIMLFVTKLSCFAQEEMLITSKSEEAINVFKEGRELSANFELSDLEKYDKALKLDPDFALAYLYRAINARSNQERTEYLDEALKRINEVTEGEKELILLYKTWYASNEAEMLSHLDKLYVLFPNDKRINLLAGTISYSRQQYDDALRYYHLALKVDENFPAAVNMLAYTYRAKEDYDQAEKYYKKYIELLPDKGAPYDSYADFLLSKERYDEAIKYYQKAIDMNDTYLYSYLRIGNIHILKEEYDKARVAFKKYFDITPILNGKFTALYYTAISYLYEENKDKALETLKEYEALARKEKDEYNEVLVNNYFGYIHSCCQNPKKGLGYYEKAANLLENSSISSDQKSQLLFNSTIGKGFAYIELNEYNQCTNELDKCKQLADKLQNVYFNAWIDLIQAYSEIHRDNIEQGIKILTDITINNTMKNYYLGLAYEKEGNMQEAMNYYAKMLNSKESGLNQALYYKHIKDKIQ